MRNEARNFEIITLWNKGIAARDIGRKLNITKNTIIGVVKRNRDRVTRPMIYCNRQKGLMSSFVRWGMKRRMDRSEKVRTGMDA
jgi:IS30 family transposase